MPAKHPDPTPPAGILHQLDLNLLRKYSMREASRPPRRGCT